MLAERAPRATNRTLVAICAHPDDETLLIGGTLAKAAADGHRVIVVLATDGELGLASPDFSALRTTRRAEVDAAAAALGVSKVVRLHYGDSGHTHPPVPPDGSLAATPLAQVQERLRSVLVEQRPDVVLLHDERGGYGHRDHVMCHRAGLAAAEQAGIAIVLEATIPRERLRCAVRLLNAVGIRPGGVRPTNVAGWYSASGRITHAIDVRSQLPAKRSALGAHRSQMTGGAGQRTLALLARLPRPIASRVLGTEWYVEVGSPPGPSRQNDVFTSSERAPALS
jgi:LmbE family N-acetylglucosaminyl deacetylase